MKKRHEIPTAFGSKRSPIQRKADTKVDSIHNSTLTEHDRALEALAMMKDLEAKRKKKLVTVRVDDRTVITSSKKRIDNLVCEYKSKKS